MSFEKAKGKHLTFDERELISEALDMKLPLGEIAKKIGKDARTISKEIKRNRIKSTKGFDPLNKSCHNRKVCSHKNVCGARKCNLLCKKCSMLNCYNICPDFTEKSCDIIKRFPHVCNGCNNITNCKLEKYKYRAGVANSNYQDLLKTSRQGIDLGKNELSRLDELITPLIMRGQSLKHIHVHHQKEIGCSQRTLYNYFDKNLFTARNIDLPRKVKYKPRKKTAARVQNKQRHRQGRSYEDFIQYMTDYPDKPIVEMDTVYGKKGEKVILTMFFRNSSLMIGLLLDACTVSCVSHAIDHLYVTLGKDLFEKHFSIILTDNGSEFKAPERLERDSDGNLRTTIFFCNPMASYQKPHIEKNHEYIRYIIPKGKSFKSLTQEKVTLIMNNINSTARASLNDKTPFMLAQLLQSDLFLEKLSLKHIPADYVLLKPSLLK